MEPISLIIIGGIALFALTRKKAATAGTPATPSNSASQASSAGVASGNIRQASTGPQRMIQPSSVPTGKTPVTSGQPISRIPASGYAFSAPQRSIGIAPSLQNPLQNGSTIYNRVNTPVNAGTKIGFVKLPSPPSPVAHTGAVSSTVSVGGKTYGTAIATNKPVPVSVAGSGIRTPLPIRRQIL